MRKETDSNSAAKHAAATISAAHLLHPTMHFDYPREVLMADNISKDEKRAILASWASDICAIESMPAWRCYPGTERIVAYDEVLAALKALDGDGQSTSAQTPMASFNENKKSSPQATSAPIRRRLRPVQLLERRAPQTTIRFLAIPSDRRVPVSDAEKIFTDDSLLT